MSDPHRLSKQRSSTELEPSAAARAVDRQPFTPATVGKGSRLRGAVVTHSVCPYCAVGCGQLIYTKGGQVIDIEGNPDSPINEGTLCPKGANTFQLSVNPAPAHEGALPCAVLGSLGRAARSTGPWTRIAERVKETRDADFIDERDGVAMKHVTTIGVARRGDAGQRRELPDQEAAQRRAGSRVDREPGPHMT